MKGLQSHIDFRLCSYTFDGIVDVLVGSSVGKSIRLITGRSYVRLLPSPPEVGLAQRRQHQFCKLVGKPHGSSSLPPVSKLMEAT